MRLLENLRKAERKSVNAMRQGMVRAREEWGDMERRLRQRMRIYPQKVRTAAMTDHPESDPEHGIHEPGIPIDSVAADAASRKPIVSVHGHDVREEELDKPAA